MWLTATCCVNPLTFSHVGKMAILRKELVEQNDSIVDGQKTDLMLDATFFYPDRRIKGRVLSSVIRARKKKVFCNP